MKQFHLRSYPALLILSVASVFSISGGNTALAQEQPQQFAPAVASPPDAAAADTLISPDRFASVPADYRLDTGDTIQVTVARHPELMTTGPIVADGQFYVLRLDTPLVVRGKTCAEVAGEMTRRLQDEGKLRLRPGQVSVRVVTARNRRIYVRGNAINGRDLNLQPGWRITEALAVIGVTPQPDRVAVTLTNPARPTPIQVDYAAAITNPESPANLALMEGDTLVIEQPQKIRLFVEGEGPRGVHDVDERFGLKRALIQLGYSINNAGGSLRNARIIRKAVPGDPNSEDKIILIDLYDLLTDDTKDMEIRDMDTLRVPASNDFILVFGEIAGPRKWFLPQDRDTYLVDVMANGGHTSEQAKIGEIQISRVVDGNPVAKKYDFGKFLKDGNPKDNPKILPGDLVFVPSTKQNKTNQSISTFWTGLGLFNVFKSFFPGLGIP